MLSNLTFYCIAYHRLCLRMSNLQHGKDSVLNYHKRTTKSCQYSDKMKNNVPKYSKLMHLAVFQNRQKFQTQATEIYQSVRRFAKNWATHPKTAHTSPAQTQIYPVLVLEGKSTIRTRCTVHVNIQIPLEYIRRQNILTVAENRNLKRSQGTHLSIY